MWVHVELKGHTSDFYHEQDPQIHFCLLVKKDLSGGSATLFLAFAFSVVFLQSANGWFLLEVQQHKEMPSGDLEVESCYHSGES